MAATARQLEDLGRFVRIEEIAKVFDVSSRTLRRRIASGAEPWASAWIEVSPGVKRFHVPTIAAWLDEQLGR